MLDANQFTLSKVKCAEAVNRAPITCSSDTRLDHVGNFGIVDPRRFELLAFAV